MTVQTKNRLGVVIGRFQTPYLHEGHHELINYVKKKNDRLIILVGCTSAKGTKTNPMDFATRNGMLKEAYPDSIIIPLYDRKSDEDWSSQIDTLLNRMDTDSDIMLYGGRDSFISHYKGRYRTEEIKNGILISSATHIRAACSKIPEESVDFRRGVIYGAYNKYTPTHPTVDVALMDIGDYVILGQKKGESRYRFIGGFVDPKDESLEEAAKREVSEECSGVTSDYYDYLGSFKVRDWRLKKDEDSIMTTFFIAYLTKGTPEPSDDIDKLIKVHVNKLHVNLVEEEHIPLMRKLMEYLNVSENVEV